MQRAEMNADQDRYSELAFYTLAHPSPSFIHQHVVDAFAVQTADENSKPIGIAFGLMGLYLHVEKNFTGKQVQKAHMRLGRHRKQWLRPALPKVRGAITIANVLAVPPGAPRDAMIHNWCVSVWKACHEARPHIVDLARTELGVS
jgi:Family of unknown function (DUF5946)